MYDVEEVEESAGRDCAKDVNAIFKYTSAKNNIGIEVKFFIIFNIFFNIIIIFLLKLYFKELFSTIGIKYLDPTGEFSDAKSNLEKSEKTTFNNENNVKNFKLNESSKSGENPKKKKCC